LCSLRASCKSPMSARVLDFAITMRYPGGFNNVVFASLTVSSTTDIEAICLDISENTRWEESESCNTEATTCKCLRTDGGKKLDHATEEATAWRWLRTFLTSNTLKRWDELVEIVVNVVAERTSDSKQMPKQKC
jgi:hypothetical protein